MKRQISGRRIATALLVAFGVIFAMAAPAAAIDCNGPYQIVRGQQIATPYCEDAYLAKVAREYGTRVSAAEIRHNPNKKADVCRFMGFDSRVSHICLNYRDGVGSPHF
ncbi:MAG: hypothetical protein KDJ37_04780 [Hyphomicrobiaceae bacterium]|nr:hypothetical protein [Hyphomicrobiaceae bacterium]